MSYCPEQDSHIRDKVKVVLNFSNYATVKELNVATVVDRTNLTGWRDFIALKVESWQTRY